MADELRGDLSEADVAAVVRNNPGDVVDAIRNQAIEPSEVESDSSSTGESDVEELSVGGTGPVTGVVGDTGDREVLGSFHATVSTKTTSTSYELLMDAGNTPRIPHPSVTDVTGYSSFYISFSCDNGDSNGTTDPVYVRLRDWPGTEIKSTSSSKNAGSHSSLVQIDPATADRRPYIEGKVEGGAELAFDSPTFFVWGEIA